MKKLKGIRSKRNKWEVYVRVAGTLRTTTFDTLDVPKMRAVRGRYFGSGTPPASTLVYVSRLAQPGWMIEVEVVAAID